MGNICSVCGAEVSGTLNYINEHVRQAKTKLKK